MPNCYECGKETPVTQFYLLRNYRGNGEVAVWWYACNLPCLKKLVRDKAIDGSFLLREYKMTCGLSWSFDTGEELRDFVDNLQ